LAREPLLAELGLGERREFAEALGQLFFLLYPGEQGFWVGYSVGAARLVLGRETSA